MNRTVLFIASIAFATAAYAADPAPQTSGTQVVVPGMGEVTAPNDEARVMFNVDEQDKDKAAAVSRANQKMKQGLAVLRRADPSALLKTGDYSTFPVYDEDPQRPPNARPRVVAWRIVQSVEMVTMNLDALPKTVAAGQAVLGLNGLNFSLSRATTKKLDQQRIDAAYRDLTERIGFIARAMGRNPADAVIELLDYEASGAYAQNGEIMMKGSRAAMAAPMLAHGDTIVEPSFAPGETTLNMRVVARIRFR